MLRRSNLDEMFGHEFIVFISLGGIRFEKMDSCCVVKIEENADNYTVNPKIYCRLLQERANIIHLNVVRGGSANLSQKIICF